MKECSGLTLVGWVEAGGRILQPDEILERLQADPHSASSFGGEFYLAFGRYTARDTLGIVPGDGPPGKILHDGHIIGTVEPRYDRMGLKEAIVAAVNLRREGSAVALSGGVDSALVAALAGCPCITVGLENSPDLARGVDAARALDLKSFSVTIEPGELEGAIAEVLPVLPEKTPLDLSIGLSWYFVTRAAKDAGYDRVLTGQGADELFGGYHRYLASPDTEGLLAVDFARLPDQIARDQAVAGIHGVTLSYPYLDGRVIRAARDLPANEKVAGGMRKRALSEVACQFLPEEIAWREKKAMQYGSGIWRELQRFARKRGFSSVGDFLARESS